MNALLHDRADFFCSLFRRDQPRICVDSRAREHVDLHRFFHQLVLRVFKEADVGTQHHLVRAELFNRTVAFDVVLIIFLGIIRRERLE